MINDIISDFAAVIIIIVLLWVLYKLWKAVINLENDNNEH